MSDENPTPAKKFELSPSVSILIAGVVIAGAIIFTNTHPAADATAAAAAPTPTHLDIRMPMQNEHIVGSPNAPIVLVEYSDFQCPFCSMIYPSLKNIVNASGGQVAWVQREFPLTSIHPQAAPAALAAECISHMLGNDAYWKYADAVFNNQASLNSQYSAQIAQQLGADPAKFAQCISQKTYQKEIDADTSEAEANGGQGTPFTIVVNTKTGKMVPISGALPQAQIELLINSVK
jgi:protein-disulfide isomerase